MMTEFNHGEEMSLRIIRYLYGDMSEQEQQDFAREADSNPQLRRLLDAEQEFNRCFPPGIQPVIDEQRMQGNRWLLRQTLQRHIRSRWSIQQWLRGLAQNPVTVAVQGAAMALAFVLGVLIAAPDPAPGLPSAASGQSPLALVNENDYEIYRMKVHGYDAKTGDIDLSFSLASETRLRGNVADESMHQLLAVALQNDIDSASRLDTINALQPVTGADQVYEALIYLLANDQNPGVRYQAVQSLVTLADEDRVRAALRQALREDVNQGVRIEAFNALSHYQDEETLALFGQALDADSNEYIRSQSRLILERM